MSSGPQQQGLRARKKERTRELIADTAMRLFVERGFEAVTVAEIARECDLDTKTVYNYFPSKPDLVYHRLEAFERSLLQAVSEREQGASILSAVAGFVLTAQGTLADDEAGERLRAVNRMIAGSPTLLAHEQQVFAGFTVSLAALIAEETGARPSDPEPWVVANALIGLHRSLVDYVRRAALAGTPNRTLRRDLRAQAHRALAPLERGLGGYGIKGAREGSRARAGATRS